MMVHLIQRINFRRGKSIAPDVGTFFSKQGTSMGEDFCGEIRNICQYSLSDNCDEIWCFTFFSTLFVILRCDG